MYSITDQTTTCSIVATTYINELIGMLMYSRLVCYYAVELIGVLLCSRVDWYVNVQSDNDPHVLFNVCDIIG